MMKLFNSEFEMRLRILLLLSQTKQGLSKEEIVDYDFITVYGADFGLGDENLHGENDFKYGEFASRQELVWIALKSLVVDGLVSVITKDGFYYRISGAGINYVNALESAYSMEYREKARDALVKYSSYSERDISKEIEEKAVSSMRRE